jgi:phytoene dehydrogenase-like protein
MQGFNGTPPRPVKGEAVVASPAMAGFDAVFVGAGVNSLASAALLSRAGWNVCVLERNDYLGGCIKTSAELTRPGFTHEVLASWHPLWTGSSAYAELKDDLDRRGVEYLNTDLPTGAAFPDGSSAFLTTSLDDNTAELEHHAARDGAAWRAMFESFMKDADLSFGVLGTELWSPAGLGLGRQALRRFGRRGLLAYAGNVLSTCRDWLGDTFESDAAHGLLAPWVLHTGLGPEQATSGFMTQVIACALQLGGMPVPKGGGVRLVEGLTGIVQDAGGELRRGAEVERILVSDGRATGVRLAGGETIRADRAVVASVTPTQLYGALLGENEAPQEVRRAAGRYRYGRGEMQIHVAMSEPPSWHGDDRLGRTAIVHVTPGLDGVSRAVNEAERGLLPAEATIVCGQPVAVDPSRAPDGSWVLWIQLQELPSGRVKGDAAGELSVGDGTWTEKLRESYADRIVARLGRHIRNLERATIERVTLSPADIAATNVNLVGGDIYGGSCALDQNFLFRPLPQAPGHRTPVDCLWHIGASTHPGPGLGAGSGYLVYKELTKPSLPRRALARVPSVGQRLQQTLAKS